jgi:hypothetical protein
MWKGLVAVFVAVPVAAVMIASAFVGQAIAENWDKATTASLVAGLVATCGGGFVVIALLVSLIVGVPLATRFFFEAGVARRAFDAPSPYVDGRVLPPSGRRPWQEETPPQLTDRQSGSWQSSGPEAYRLWEEEPAEVDRNNW